MKKLIIVSIVVLVLSSCQNEWEIEEALDLKNLGYNNLYYLSEFDTLTSYYDISFYIRNHVTYVEDSKNTDPETILRTGEANCNGYSILFANIAYFSMNIKMQIASVDTSYRTRSIIDGGHTNHTICYYDGTLVDPQQILNPIIEYSKIGYLYSFDQVLH